MWTIFLSAFGSICWIGKIVADRISSGKADVDATEKRKSIERWDAQTIDRDLERMVKDSHASGGIVAQCDDAILFVRSIPGLSGVDFDLSSSKHSKHYVSMFLLYWQMVKNGKLPAMHNTELGNYLELAINTTLTKKSRIAFGVWVEQSLQSHGVEHANLYYTGKDRDSFVWEPFVSEPNNAIRITDSDLERKSPGR